MRQSYFRVAALKAVAVSLGTGVVRSDVAGFTRPDGPSPGCTYNTGNAEIQYFLSNSGYANWDQTTQVTPFVDGADNWELMRSLGSTQGVAAGRFVNVTRLTSEPLTYADNQFKVTLEDVDTGKTNCVESTHTIKIPFDATGNYMRYLAGHEIGHGWGLRHTGAYDNLTNSSGLYGATGWSPYPLMSGDIAPSGTNYYLPKVDDWASVSHKRSANRSAAPDGGFETGNGQFYLTGTAVRDNDFPFRGQWDMRLEGVASIQQRVRIRDAGDSYTFVAKYKGTTTSGSLKGQARIVTQGSSTCAPNCPYYPTGFDWVTLANQSLSTQTTYTNVAINNSSNNWSSAFQVDSQIQLFNNDSNGALWVDNIEVRNVP